MFKKKENLKYFLGGAAVGVTAGFIAGKLLPNISITEHPNCGMLNTHVAYSQDDNIYSSLYSQKSQKYSHSRSKSATRHEINFEQPSPANVQLETSKDYFQDNLNNLKVENKSNMNLDKLTNNNISIEDNRYAMYGKNDTNEYQKCNLSEVCDTDSNMAVDNIKNNLSTVNTKIVEKKLNNENINIELYKSSGSFRNTEAEILPDMCNSLSIDDNTLFNNFSHIERTAIKPHMLQSFISGVIDVENVSNVATCNTLRNFEETMDEEVNKSDLESSDEFYKNDPISSTKWTDSEDI